MLNLQPEQKQILRFQGNFWRSIPSFFVKDFFDFFSVFRTTAGIEAKVAISGLSAKDAGSAAEAEPAPPRIVVVNGKHWPGFVIKVCGTTASPCPLTTAAAAVGLHFFFVGTKYNCLGACPFFVHDASAVPSINSALRMVHGMAPNLHA